MKTILTAASVILVVSVQLAVSGCGSNSTSSAVDQVLEPRIQEYVGDGGGSLKPWPDLLGVAIGDRPGVVAPKIRWGNSPKADKVPRKQVSWYRLEAFDTWTPYLIVTVQPTANEDSDLYLLEGKGKDFDDGVQLVASSRRAPSDPDATAGGYAPDWVAYQTTHTHGWPAGYVAIAGVNEEPATKHYRIEVDAASAISVNGPQETSAVCQYESHWWVFDVAPGTHYTVTMTPTSGDPDVFVYGGTSSDFIGSDTTAGTAVIPFIAASADRHHIRIYGYGSSSNGYTLEVTSP